ncbi:MAG TPA: peptidoglycan editing factor PgeF [Mycobacteriales bacterium]|nr:peptidoglycan editing factor PgeF [Mycobacteriales bacterium]
MRVTAGFTGRFTDGAVSAAPYDTWNLGTHVGDDPAAVTANRALLAQRTGVDVADLVFMEQVHGPHIAVVDGRRPDAVPGVDAVITAEPGLALVVLVADCVPVLLVDPASGVRAAVHAGRRGVANGIVTATVEQLRTMGANPWARLGPCIGGCCYEVGPDVFDEVVAVAPEAASTTRAGTRSLDLRRAVVAQLERAGVQQVSADAACTADDPRCFSYRRDGVTGRMAGIVAAFA